jgi:translation initiation factor 2B subunit (eIF-2B alpha/beta/delta family)/8-oxo-dGTP pyrophosphatase MutT (NUDIX family)
LEYKSVVTSFLLADQRILLLRRSAKVGTYKGRWAAVSGYLEGSDEPLQRARIEIQEEVSLGPEQISLIRAGETLRAFDEQTETVWIVHPFLFEARSKAIRLDWESTEYRWVDPNELGSYEPVPKLKETFDRVRCNLQAAPTVLFKVLQGVDVLAQDRVHGASVLGREAIDLLSAAAEASEAVTTEDLFCDLLLVASRLRNAQPGMVIIRNLVGMLLYQAGLKRGSSVSAAEFRKLISSLAKEVIERSKEASEDASRNAVAILPEYGHVLTHSYSSTVLRALELGMKGGRKYEVYAVESYPGMEGKQLAKDLVNIGVPVKLIADSALGSIISDVDLVLVGADSVLTDGSLVHKVGTKYIAAGANEREIPFYSACETTKFSTADFLGEPAQPSEALFDITPSKYVSKFITETGAVEPREVEARIRVMLREIYP